MALFAHPATGTRGHFLRRFWLSPQPIISVTLKSILWHHAFLNVSSWWCLERVKDHTDTVSERTSTSGGTWWRLLRGLSKLLCWSVHRFLICHLISCVDPLRRKEKDECSFLNYPKAVRCVFGVTFHYDKKESREYLKPVGSFVTEEGTVSWFPAQVGSWHHLPGPSVCHLAQGHWAAV